jgi:transcriptional regulator with PAS, ATPase and Fis domain
MKYQYSFGVIMENKEYLSKIKEMYLETITDLPGFKTLADRTKIIDSPYFYELDKKEIVIPEHYSKFKKLVYNHSGMEKLVDEIKEYARTDFHVFLTGETGTGKELVAEALHELSNVKDKKKFVKVNCAAIPEQLIESELFGYVKGAFTGADKDKPGLFEEAHNGTLFLDEIHTISIRAQHKLFRFFTDNIINRVGATKEGKKVNVRVISASSKDLKDEAVRDKYKVDDQFYYRIEQTYLKIPSLRERGYDYFILMYHFLKKFFKVDSLEEYKMQIALLLDLAYYKWPGNVRDLENLCRQLSISKDKLIRHPGNRIKAFLQLNGLIEQLEKDDFSDEEIALLLNNSNKYLSIEKLKKEIFDTIKTAPIKQSPKQMVRFIYAFLMSDLKGNDKKNYLLLDQKSEFIIDDTSTYSELENKFKLSVLKSRYSTFKSWQKVADSLSLKRGTLYSSSWAKKLGIKLSDLAK